MGGSSPKPPEPPPLPPPPPEPVKRVDERVARARQTNRRQAALARGRGSTILTSPLGLESEATTAGKRVLGS